METRVLCLTCIAASRSLSSIFSTSLVGTNLDAPITVTKEVEKMELKLLEAAMNNMELPHFGAVQPGETYYLTPAKSEDFGVADVSHIGDDGKDADHLYFHCYQEGDGANGGTNVASMIMKTLHETKIIRTDENGAALRAKELNIVMDNCAGQNKNNYVLLLAPYLVEMGYFSTVNMLFLVVGHTKNVCNRRFNNMKQEYHKSQVFTVDEAVEVLGRNQKFPLLSITYFVPTQLPNTSDGVTMKFHAREPSLEDHGKVYADNIIDSKFAANGDRREKLKSVAPPPTIYNGLPGYKQILMHKSYSQYVPSKYRNNPLYKEPSPDVVDAEAKDQRERIANKKMRKASISFTSGLL
ncbi:hypothetical protein IV203_016672 [Nitzschia inconspicua]|uniref:DUF7869 domain-containing protein n=1 Tax=Nitzschia inconspicua TaxID=303405 RepID=A0A9K3PHL4_9STRA|nr:hypothetical protein IV203_016672 [Nitzschia inconspicua]